MSDSANAVQACACGGTLVITPTRPGVDVQTEHHDAEGNIAVCPVSS